MKIIVLATCLKTAIKLNEKLCKIDSKFPSNIAYNKKKLLKDKENIVEIEFIFSTWNMPIFCEEEIRIFFPKLKAIFYCAGTVKYFAKPFLSKGVRIFSANRVNAIPVAEFVLGQILLANKGYFQALRNYRKPFWRFSFHKSRRFSLSKAGNFNSKIGIIGCGSIGSLLINYLKNHDLCIFAHDPYISMSKKNELDVKFVDLKWMFENCDIISNHLPDTVNTKGIIDYKLLSLMKDNSTFINTGRGSQVVEKDLVNILSSKKNICALLDVTINEPVVPFSKLNTMQNVFLSPHIAGSLSNEENRLIESMHKSYKNFYDSKFDLAEVQHYDLENNA